MLPQLHSQRYQEFQQVLKQMHETAAAQDLQFPRLREQLQELQQLFNSQIVILSSDNLTPEYASRWQSLQTEIYKQMRLLDIDVMLLQASRSSATSLSRAANLRERINTLMVYCQTLLQL
ncbi:MAG: heterocyst frequency control protein PatD [Symploca sp. SIO3C6]|uniref:Heterocyst frequency control protein PatD n=1 Tax=Symploca sp. SIO1C4 TaxID=2607765 RepID=A0A6B3N9J3_9CYAN|nr:heterocyst frequency control protein PatD [Symploca sp. SIO3C6]NER30276.1 heterocyst frequency control protein PatD [Symploca sp. SIO1C4]NET04186.1 heterocyst frequency control protein PatD [Symploca sp. SIO2B6]